MPFEDGRLIPDWDYWNATPPLHLARWSWPVYHLGGDLRSVSWGDAQTTWQLWKYDVTPDTSDTWRRDVLTHAPPDSDTGSGAPFRRDIISNWYADRIRSLGTRASSFSSNQSSIYTQHSYWEGGWPISGKTSYLFFQLLYHFFNTELT